MSECPICFHEFTSFKQLACEHYLCEQCLADLVDGRVVAVNTTSNNLKPKSTTERPSDSAVALKQPSAPPSEDFEQVYPAIAATATGGGPSVECPTCRRRTALDPVDGIKALPTKFVGIITCNDCDEDKSVTDFRWCKKCVMSVCSSCYLDKHQSMAADGTVQFHESSKWDSHDGVRFLLSQMKRTLRDWKQGEKETFEYLNTYIYGLNEMLRRNLQSHSTQRIQTGEQQLNQLCQLFGIKLSEVKTAEEYVERHEYVAKTVVQLTGKCQEARNIRPSAVKPERPTLRFRSVPYVELLPLFIQDESGQETNVEDLLNRRRLNMSGLAKKLPETNVLGAGVLKSPADICALGNKWLLIADFETGIFAFDQTSNTLVGALSLKHKYSRFYKVTTVPDEPNLAYAVVQLPSGTQGYILISGDEENNSFEQLSIGGKEHWASVHGAPKPVQISASNELLMCLSADHKLMRFHLPSLTGQTDEAAAAAGSGKPGSKAEAKANKREDRKHRKHGRHHKATPGDDWRVVLPVPPASDKQLQLGPIVDRAQHSQLYLFNPTWCAIDIHNISHAVDPVTNTSAVGAIRRVELPSPLSMGRAFGLVINERMLYTDKSTNKLALWNMQDNSVELVHEFRNKQVQSACVLGDALHFVFAHNNDQLRLRSLETVYL